MTPGQTKGFWQRAFLPEEHRPLTPAESALVIAATYGAAYSEEKSFSSYTLKAHHLSPDVGRMTKLIEAEPGLLESIGPALACLTTTLPGCAASLKLLLERGVPLRIDPGEYNVLHEARAETARVVFQAGAADASGVAPTVHTGWPNNVSLLYWPAVFGSSEDAVEHVEVLLDHGADPEVKIQGNGERGNTVLQEAVSPYGPGQEGKRRVARKLIERGASYDLLSACGLDDLARVRECAREADVVGCRGEAEMTPLHWAARAGAMDCARWLLDRGAEIDAVTKAGNTPLHLAAERGAAEAVWLLIGRNADMGAQDKKGRTPLHRATYNGHVDAAEALIVCGADTTIETRTGKTPLQLAQLDCKYLRAG